MKLKSIISCCLLLLTVIFAKAQNDSINLSIVQPEYDFLYKELFNFAPNSIFGELKFDQPVNKYATQSGFNQPLVIDFNSFQSFKTISLSNSFPVFNPFINSFSVTNQAHYKLSDKLMFGGNSFSANDIFNPTPLNPSVKDMSIRGASMFLQYKISDKVKVGGSISISNRNSPFTP